MVLISIENAWAFLKKRLLAHPTYPTNTTDLFNILESEWMLMPDGYFVKLLRSMRTIVSFVKLNRGKSTKY